MSAELLEQPQSERAPNAKPRVILVIDDDPSQVEVLCLRLQRQGFRSLAAHSGRQGRELARKERPDLVVLDLRLPDGDGLDLCAEFTDSPDTCQIPVIIVSGMEGPDIIRNSRRAGCHFFLRKPYDPNALLTLIQHALHEEPWEGAGPCEGPGLTR